MSVTGSKDGRPMPLGISLADQLCSYHIVYAVLAALIHRMKSGRGQHIEVDMLRACLAHQGQELLFAMTLGKSFERPTSGIAHPGMPAPFGVYRTFDGWMTISMNPVERLAELLGLPELAACDAQRLWDERDAVHALIEARTATASTAHWVELLLAAGLWAGEVNSLQEVATLDQANHLGAFTSYEHPAAGTVRTVGIPVSLSETPGEIRRPAPRIGEHSREILAGFGFAENEIEAWIADGIVGDLQAPAPPEKAA